MLFATTVSAILLVSSTLVQAVPNTTAISFLLMVASGRSPDFSTLVPTVDQTLEEINMKSKFNMKYKINDTEVSVEQCLELKLACSNAVQCNKGSSVLLQ